MTNIIDSLNWRYATKAFDNNKKVSTEDLETIIDAFRLTASSFGLEPWKLVIVENTKIRAKLLENSWNQKQIVDASHLLVLTRIKNIDEKYINKFLDNNSKITGATREQLKGYEDMIKGFFSRMNESEKTGWAREQVYLALGNVMTVLADKKIDSCAIGGFSSEKYDEILELDEKGLSSVVVLPIGYRKDDDKYSTGSKVRFGRDQIVEFIK